MKIPNFAPWIPAALACLLAGKLAEAQIGDVYNVHDPAIIKAGDKFYLFLTGAGIPMRESSDLYNWKSIGPSFKTKPTWAAEQFPNARDFWAPDVSFFGGTYHLYYAVSVFGRNTSAIGLATSKSLDPASPDFGWVDQGKVIETKQSDDWNAIDGNVAFDEKGEPWLVAGSFWTGIKMRKLDPQTGLLSDADTKMYSLAARQEARRAIEAPFMIHHGDYYYLFVSFDVCCRGVNSTYKTMVGRSKSITGPFVDMQDKPMLEGGASLVISSQGPVRGPGHCAILTVDGRDFLVHHFYDGDNRGRRTLQIRPIIWDNNGWPLAGEPISGPLQKPSVDQVNQQKVDLTGAWLHSIDFGEESKIELMSDGRIQGPSTAGATWKLDGHQLTLNWPVTEFPDQANENCYVSDDGSWFVGRIGRGLIVRGRKPAAEKKPAE